MAYIDTKYLFECETCRHDRSGKCDVWCENGEFYSPNLSKIPTADVVEVVRCKDCKCYIPDSELDHNEYPNPLDADGLCENIDKYTDETDFCSYGERRDT